MNSPRAAVRRAAVLILLVAVMAPFHPIHVLAVLVTMLYWLRRVRIRGTSRGIVVVSAPQAAR